MYPNPTDPLNGDAASLCEYLKESVSITKNKKRHFLDEETSFNQILHFLLSIKYRMLGRELVTKKKILPTMSHF